MARRIHFSGQARSDPLDLAHHGICPFEKGFPILRHSPDEHQPAEFGQLRLV
jgi:hypothetical protein